MRKSLLEDCQRLRISDVRSVIPHDTISALLEISGHEINIIGRLTNLKNGYRYYFLCPECRLSYESLYRADLGSWKCRQCIDGAYASTRKIVIE